MWRIWSWRPTEYNSLRKIIVTGKGGVGKTTTVATLALMMAREGRRVIVFDTDPSMNLAMSFGIPYGNMSTITEDKAEIFHGLEEDGMDELGEEIINNHSALTEEGIRVVVMGPLQHGGDGCLCSAVSMVKALVDFVEKDGGYDMVIVDSQAGPEVLGRGLASSFDINIILSEPTVKSFEVSRQVNRLGKDLGIRETVLVVNKIDNESDSALAAGKIGVDLAMTIGVPYDRCVVNADKEGKILLDAYPESVALGRLREIKGLIEKTIW